MVKRLILATVLLLFVSLANYAQNTGVKSNLLYWATTTPNLGVETALGKKHTAQVFFGFNPWKQSGGDQSSLRHWLLQPEYRLRWMAIFHIQSMVKNICCVLVPYLSHCV